MEGGEGNYRTSSTPIWVCVSFSPHLARRRKSALTGDLLVRLVVGLRFHRLFEAWEVVGPAGYLHLALVVGFNYIATSWLGG